ncbi:MAG: MGDG synthase family glycosyltransferase [Anaerolineae bacterium]
MDRAARSGTELRHYPSLRPQTKSAISPQRFLFLFSDTGGGHRASAQAVKDELVRLYGSSAAVEMLDIFVEMNRWPFHRFPAWYPTAVGLNGIPWGVGFHLSDGVRLMTAMSKLLWPYARTPLCDLLRRHPADVIVSFHPIPNCAIFLALQRLGQQPPVVIVTLDLVTAHAGWFTPGAHLYTVPTYAAKARALRWGLPESRIRVTGMPTRRSFLLSMDLPKSQARAQLHLPQEKAIVLIVGGGEGMGPLGQVVRAIAEQRPNAHIVVITGRNQALYEELANAGLPGSVQVEGFVSNMEVWMRAADLLVTKAGPNTLAEAFIPGLPLVLYTALPGQEAGNVDHVVENGAGIWAPLPRLAAQAVMELLNNPSARASMARRSQALARPFATEQIAQALWSEALRHQEAIGLQSRTSHTLSMLA